MSRMVRVRDTSAGPNTLANVLFATTLIASTCESSKYSISTLYAREFESVIFEYFDSRKCNVCSSFRAFPHSHSRHSL